MRDDKEPKYNRRDEERRILVAWTLMCSERSFRRANGRAVTADEREAKLAELTAMVEKAVP